MFRLLAWRTKNMGERTTMLATLPNGMLYPALIQRSRDTTLLPKTSKKTCVDSTSIDQGFIVVSSPAFCCLTSYFAVAKPRYIVIKILSWSEKAVTSQMFRRDVLPDAQRTMEPTESCRRDWPFDMPPARRHTTNATWFLCKYVRMCVCTYVRTYIRTYVGR